MRGQAELELVALEIKRPRVPSHTAKPAAHRTLQACPAFRSVVGCESYGDIMCASYGLDPRFNDDEHILAGDVELLDGLRSWAVNNAGATLLPTGKHLRNLNPIIREAAGRRSLELAWWGYLVDGAPSKFPSINTRSERLANRSSVPGRALVPATAWYEMQKPQRQWFEFNERSSRLFTMAAVTQPGRAADGQPYTCYSIVMRPADGALAEIHDRVPLLIPANFASEWMTSDASAAALIDDALAQSASALAAVGARPIVSRPA